MKSFKQPGLLGKNHNAVISQLFFNPMDSDENAKNKNVPENMNCFQSFVQSIYQESLTWAVFFKKILQVPKIKPKKISN